MVHAEVQTAPPAVESPMVNGRWAGYRNLVIVRMKELGREPEMVFWTFAFPVLLALGLGIAFRDKPAEVTPIAVVANAQAQQVLELLRRSPASSVIRADLVDQAKAFDRFRLGTYALVVTADANGIQYRYDPARPESVLARSQVDDAIQSSAGRSNPLKTESTQSSEPGSRYIDFLVPGLIGMNLMNSGMWGVGYALVEMRQRKLLKRFVATPMRRSDFLLALMTSRLVLMFLEVGLLLIFGVLFFHMRVMGSVWAILLWGAIGSVAFGGLGLLTASRAQKIESISGLMNAVMMPMWIFSGVFFSYERFPAILHPFIKALPLTALNDALRASILEGTPLMHQWGRLLVLGLWGGVSFVLAVRWFRWT